MKTVKLFIYLSFICFSFLSCTKEDSAEHTDPEYYQYFFALSVRDASGNDLVAPFKDAEQTDNYTLTLDLYSLSNGTHPGYSPKFEITDKLVEGKWYLFNECMYFRKYGPQESITYNITFPAVFGDELKHSVVTYWGDDPYLSSGRILHSIKPECTRALFDGQEITVKKVSRATLSREVFFYFIDIILDR